MQNWQQMVFMYDIISTELEIRFLTVKCLKSNEEFLLNDIFANGNSFCEFTVASYVCSPTSFQLILLNSRPRFWWLTSLVTTNVFICSTLKFWHLSNQPLYLLALKFVYNIPFHYQGRFYVLFFPFVAGKWDDCFNNWSHRVYR